MNKQEQQKQEESIDSKLLKSRNIIISDDINKKTAKSVINQLLLMANDNDDPITIFINSPGGEVYSGFAIYDTMKFIKPKVRTVITGLAASMGSIISLGATKGERYCLPNAMILIHQPLIQGTIRGSITDINIHAKEIVKVKNKLINLYIENTGKDFNEIKNDIDRDNWIDSKEAKEYGPKGLVDHIISEFSEIKN